MTNKAYIVANEEQENEVLEQFETKGYVWFGEGEKTTEFVPSHIIHLVEFPYVLLDDDDELSWLYIWQLDNQKIVYDGRKESKMKISKEVYDALVEWQKDIKMNWAHTIVNTNQLEELPTVAYEWWESDDISDGENNNRLIAIIRWVNGEDVFEVEKPKKWVVQSKDKDSDNYYSYVYLTESGLQEASYNKSSATKFDTKEEAKSWANAHQEVIEVEE